MNEAKINQTEDVAVVEKDNETAEQLVEVNTADLAQEAANVEASHAKLQAEITPHQEAKKAGVREFFKKLIGAKEMAPKTKAEVQASWNEQMKKLGMEEIASSQFSGGFAGGDKVSSELITPSIQAKLKEYGELTKTFRSELKTGPIANEANLKRIEIFKQIREEGEKEIAERFKEAA